MAEQDTTSPAPKRANAQSRLKQVEAAFQHATALHREGKLDKAIAGYRQVVQVAPSYARAYNNLGVALRAKSQYAAAVVAYERSLANVPHDAGALSNMGNALRALGRFEEAEAAHRAALEAKPGYAEARYNLSLVLKDLGRFAESLDYLNETVRAKPDYAEAHWDRALAWLQAGDLERGFAEYEWRWRLGNNPPRDFTQPIWDGEPIDGQTLLVHCEQGMGDSIQFVRYLALLNERCGDNGKVVLECQAPLTRLFARLDGLNQVVTRGEPLPDFDFHVPLLTLPRIFGTSLNTIPGPSPYLHPYDDDKTRFAPALVAPPGWLKVGLCWAGKSTQRNDRNRSCGLAPMLGSIGVPGAVFYGLQVGPRVADLDQTGARGLIRDISPQLKDFADTAAVVSQLDLVVSVDTSVAHLAGALDKPTWIALTFTGDWRYLDRQETTPWYPSARIFQQDTYGDWRGVFARIKRALLEEINRRTRSGTAAGGN
ncbi:MAG: tetratricopeptide repeat-containing glycosyltransferase family protein [Alphaproteobacteria bacterium]|nr:tetratricopeptide repeat-containing glycosyltransferase family protein [Alphaproteobacteria bacterium]